MKPVLVLAFAIATVAAQQGDPVVHVSKEPRHRVMFEAGTTRIQDVQIPAGDTSLYHIHDHALLYVPISSSRVRTQVLGADWGGGVARDGAARSGRGGAASAGSSVRSESPLGTARGNLEPVERSRARVTSTTSYVEKPLTHRVGNVGDTLYRLIAIGNLSKGADVDSDNVSGLGTPELVNRYYRAFRVSLAPDDSTPPHRHAWPVVLVQQTAGRLTIDGSFQATTTTTLPGAFAYDLGSGVHLVKNSGRTTTEFVEVELRGGAPK